MDMAVNNIAFGNQYNNDDNSVRVTEVGVVGGATVGGAKYGTGALKRMINTKKTTNVQDLISLSNRTTQGIKEAANAGSKVKSLWAQVGVNAKKFTNSIVEWAKATSTGKLTKRIVNSKAFGKVSGVVGGLGAVFVFISGIGEMGNVINKASQKPAYALNYEA